jgi:hypothetical protein
MSYIQNEILKIRSDQIHAKNHENYRKSYMKQTIICVITALLTIGYCYSDEIACPHCAGTIEIGVEAKGILKDVWVCSNPYCRYENYVGINTCVQCGRPRYK